MKKGVLIFGLIFLALCLVMPSAASAEWYTCTVYKVVPRADGDVYVQLDPGTSETKFSTRVRGYIDGTRTGSKQILAVLLTAISLESDVTIFMDAATFDPVQEITSAGLVAY